MLLVADNAPYHHKRNIGSLASLSKKQLVELIAKHEVEYVDLPITSDARLELANLEDDDENVQNRGEVVRIIFCKEEQLQRVGVNKPRVGTLEELKVSFVHYLKEHDPQQLKCKVEQLLLDRGHNILWTPPYYPELQPIELFWAAGKNHVAQKFETNQTMRNVVKYLGEGWYVQEW